MAEDRAVIRAELEGTGKVSAGAKKLGSDLAGAKKQGEGVKEGIKGAQGEVKTLGDRVDGLKDALSPRALLGASIGGLVVGTIGAAISYLKEGAAQARQWGEATSGTARRSSLELAGLRSQLQANELSTLQSAESQLALVDAVQEGAGAGQQAGAELGRLSALATALGRDVQSLAGTFISLRAGANVGDVVGEMERLYATARRLDTIGGPEQLLRTIEALRPAFASVNTDAPGAAQKLTAFAAVASKRLKPEQAQAVVSGAIGAIESNAYNIQRALGKDPLDEKGDVADPLQTLRDLRVRAMKQNGGDRRLATMGLTKLLGARTARFVLSKDFDSIEQEARNQERADVGGSVRSVQETPEAARKRLELVEKQRQLAAGQVTQAGLDAAGQAKEQAYRVAADSVSMPAAAATDPLQQRLAQAGIAPGSSGGGPVMVELNTQQIQDIGAATAAALRGQPPQIRLTPHPNDRVHP